MESLEGQLLIASPRIEDPNFTRTVIAVAHHDDDGALGIVLNRPSTTPIDEALPDTGLLPDVADVVFVGGPVNTDSIIVLAEFRDPRDAAYLVCERIGLVSDRTGVDGLADAATRCRVYAGYAGWSAGQLEAELDRADWIIEPALPVDVFDTEPDDLWRAALERKGGNFRLLARMPPDPSLN